MAKTKKQKGKKANTVVRCLFNDEDYTGIDIIGFDDTPPIDMDYQESINLLFEMEDDVCDFNPIDAMEFACINVSRFKRGSIPLELRASPLNPWDFDRKIANDMLAKQKENN